MKRLCIFTIALSTLLLVPAGAAQAADDSVRFLHALQENGYGDVAVEYLKSLKDQPDLPAELRDVWDLEMSKSLRSAAGAAFDDREANALMEESQNYLTKFVKEKPDHPDALIATANWGEFLVKRALDTLRAAKNLEGKDKEQREKLLAEARAGLIEARGKFQEAEAKVRAKLAEMPAPTKQSLKRSARGGGPAPREMAEANLYRMHFQLGLIDYYLAQTYSDPKSDERTALLKKAAQAFDDIFQRNRDNEYGTRAHMWHGKAVEELGDLQMALDIYDEVMARAPDPSDRNAVAEMEPLFAQVEQFRLAIIAKRKPTQFLPEATAWLKDYGRLRRTDGYQGIALETAKAWVNMAETSESAKKAEYMARAMQIVTENAKVRSQYQPDFFALRRDMYKSVGRNFEANTFDDAVIAGNAAAESAEWPKALEYYTKALEIAEKTKLKNFDVIDAVRENADRVRYRMACELFDAGKFSECIEAAGKIIRDDNGRTKKESEAAAEASALAVEAALNLYRTAPDDKKADTLDRLMKVAEFTEKNWPDRPQADDARMARAQAKLVAGKVHEAINVFDRVNPKSERYATAMYWAGLNYWRLYLTEKFKKKGEPDKEQMAADRAKTLERLGTALRLFKRRYEPGGPMPPYMLETQLLLAEVYSEGGDAAKAVEYYQPLIDAIRAEKPKTFNASTVRVFLGAVRAYCTLNEIDKAGAVSGVLIELGPDTQQVNHVLVGFARLLNVERQKADARMTELENSANAGEVTAAKARQASVGELLGKTLLKLSERKELSLGHRVFIGQTLNTIGMTEQAGEQFQKILKRVETDPEFAAQAEKAMSLIRTELLKTLRKQKKYAEALEQVDKLIAKHPNALEPLMERGYVLEGLAETDPAKFKDAIAHWTMLRNRLQRMRPKPKEYYDVMYNVANCLVRDAEQSQDKAAVIDSAKKAEQVLKSPLILSPKLNGPDTVAKYKVLLNKAIALQGRSAEAKDSKKP